MLYINKIRLNQHRQIGNPSPRHVLYTNASDTEEIIQINYLYHINIRLLMVRTTLFIDGGVSFIGGCDRSDRTKPAASDWQT
jgi:hypothetical protein